MTSILVNAITSGPNTASHEAMLQQYAFKDLLENQLQPISYSLLKKYMKQIESNEVNRKTVITLFEER